jgi:hypothetical protein
MIIAALAAACVDTPPLHEPETESSHVSIRELPPSRPAKLDVLVVVDDTIAMAPHEDRMATLPALLADKLGWMTRNWVDLQVAVTSNDGQFHRLPGSPSSFLTDAWDFDYTRRHNFPGTLAEALTTLMTSGGARSGPNQPLESMRRALEGNSQFVRDDAAFTVIVISASDDASPLPVSDYVDWMRKLAGQLDGEGWGRKPVRVIGIHAQGSPRLDEYYRLLGTNVAIATPIDNVDLGHALSLLPPIPRSLLGPPCLEHDDLDPIAPGFQYDCVMSVFVGGEMRSVPECSASERALERSDGASQSAAPAPPCWYVAADRQNCLQPFHKLGLAGYNGWGSPAARFECRAR